MNYVVNDIEGLIELNRLSSSTFHKIINICDSISLTNMKISSYSGLMTPHFDLLMSKGVIIKDVSSEMYVFRKRNSLKNYSDGDISSIYQAYIDRGCLITENKFIIDECQRLQIKTINIDELIMKAIADKEKLEKINNLKIIYKRQIKDII